MKPGTQLEYEIGAGGTGASRRRALGVRRQSNFARHR
jgi:hypothetical protein